MAATPALEPAAAEDTEQAFWLAKFRGPIFFFLAVLTAAGVYLALGLPISVFPDTDFPRIVIGVDNGVTPIEQMQVTVTRPLEDAMNVVPGLETVRSTTSRGSAEVSLFFAWGTDMAQALQLVNAELGKVRQALPPTAVLTTNRLTFATFPILGYSLQAGNGSASGDPKALWELATYTLKPPLNRVPGVRSVLVQGGQIPEYHLVPNMARMQTAGVTILDFVTAIDQSNTIDSPGLYEADHQLVLGLVGAQAHDADGLAALSVKTSNGLPIRVGDVARVEQAAMPAYTVVTANGKPSVLLTIARQPTSNTVAVADAVEREIAQLRRTLPPGVTLTPFYDQSELVRASIRSVRDAILIGLALACLILFLFLRDTAASLVAGLVIPVTIAVTILFLSLIGESFNLMTLGGLAAAIGLVIDDAIVVIENIVLHRDAGEGPVRAVRLALREITVPLIGSTVTPVVVFLPLVAVSGVTGSFLRALALTMTAALLTSLALAITFTPALSLVFLRNRRATAAGHETGRWMRRVLQAHGRALGWALRRPLALGAACVLLIACTYLGYNALGSDLLPAMDEGGFILDYVMPAGSSLAETNRVLGHVEQILRATPEVDATSRRTGMQMGLAAVTEANSGDFTVRLRSKRSRGIDEVIAGIREQVKRTEPALDIEFTQVLQDMIGDLSNAPQPIQIKLFTQDPALLTSIGPRVADAIGKVPGVVDVQNGVENTISGPATNFQINSAVAARLGFTSMEVAEDATTLLDGVAATTPLIANGRPYTVRVRLGPETRASLDAMENTVFNSQTGKLATLGSLATITGLPPQNEIRRENLQGLVTVTGRLEGSDMGTAIARVQRSVAALHLPAQVRVEYGGTYQEQQKSFADLLRVLVLSLALVFGVLLVEFRSFSAPAAVLTSSVLSVAGVVAALFLTGTDFNVSSFMGLIMVIGIVAKNGILLLDADERFRAAGMGAREAMVEAARRRLRPILMTAAAAISGMLPLAFALGAGSEMLQPLAIAVIGGLLVSLVLSLLVTPVVYFLLTRGRHGEPMLPATQHL